MEEKARQEMPDSYGTGRAPVERSRAPMIVALLGILLGTNLMTAGFFLGLGTRQTATESAPDVSGAEKDATVQPVPADLSGEELLNSMSSGLAHVTAREDGQTSSNTGIILSSDGYILTNASALENADDLTVTLSDGSLYTAYTVGMDLTSDIAVLKIEAKNLKPAGYAQSDNVAVGDSLTLLAFPFGTAELTEVLVEDTQRLIGGIERRIFRVDCGGGCLLVNEDGQLVAFGTRGDGALPMSEAIALAGELILYGSLNDPNSFGMEVSQLDEAQRSYWELPGGVVINRVVEEGNADRAGLQAGDVLLSIGGSPVTDTQSYWQAVGDCCQGEKVTVEIYRSGQRLRLELLLEQEEE